MRSTPKKLVSNTAFASARLVQLDPQKVETSSVKITIEAASINTRVERRDTHLRSKDFFAVDQYPQITFVSKKINKTGVQLDVSKRSPPTIRGGSVSRRRRFSHPHPHSLVVISKRSP